jgi:hypothetical protein
VIQERVSGKNIRKKNELTILQIGMIRNKQYPFRHIPNIKTHDGIRIPSHEFIHRMTTPQWFHEQKVRNK